MAHFKIDNEEQGEALSRKMWDIMSPNNTTCTHLFGWGTDSNGQAYIDIDVEMVCPVYVNDNFAQVLQDVGVLLNIPQTEGAQLRQYLEGGQVVLGNLIPSTLEEFTPYFEKANIYG
jgi:hypothetical protein